MWELLFEETPFSDMESDSILFRIPSRVIKGQRPRIPFNTEKEMKEWIEETILQREDYPIEKVTKAIHEYITLTKQCWDADPSLRPDFNTITQCIANISL